jgi:hypothetical protein
MAPREKAAVLAQRCAVLLIDGDEQASAATFSQLRDETAHGAQVCDHPAAAGKTVINMRFDSALLQRIDAAAKRQGISRTAWLHVAAANALDK